MKNDDVQSALAGCALLSCLGEENLADISAVSELRKFVGGEDISVYTNGRLAVVVDGRANVMSRDGERNTLIRVLGKWDVFGVAGLFSRATEVSRVIATVRTSVLFIPSNKILEAISKNSEFAKRYITFLENRIVFLNRRISAFTAGSCERRLATFLRSVSSEESFELSGIPFSSLARQLDMGRASFYRALETLEAEGAVLRGQKSIFVLSRSLLKEKYN